MGEPSDINELSATQHIDGLMRRVLFLLFGAGQAAILVIWWMEWHDGSLNPTNAIAYPAMAFACLLCLLALMRWPGLLGPVRWIGFLFVTCTLALELMQEVLRPTPMLASYNAMTLLNWLPLCYALAFFMLEARQARWAAGALLAFVAMAVTIRGTMSVPYAIQDRALMINTLISHAVLVVCLSGLLWLKRFVTEQGEQATRLRLLASTDPLTGLANRRQTLRLLEALARENRPDLAPVIVLCDLDHFKRVNDDCGHEVGDRVLVEVASALRANTRDSDTVSRWGGEEFLVVLPRTRPGEANELAERLRLCTEALSLRDRNGQPVPVTMSLGVAVLAANETAPVWLRRADDALYRAKDLGRNRAELAPHHGADATPACESV